MRVVFAGAPSGGHLYPGIALARALSRRWGIPAHFVVEGRALESRIIRESDGQVHRVPAFRMWDPIRAVTARRSLASLFRRLEPSAVVCLGGRPGVLPALAAATHSVPIFLLEQNRVVGRAHRVTLPLAERIFVAFPDTRGSTWLRRRALVLGCPVREEFTPTPFPNEGRLHVVVMGGSQGSVSLNELMEKSLPHLRHLADRIRITHVTGARKGLGLGQCYERTGIDATVVEYLEHPGPCLQTASLVVARAGGSTLAELTAVGRGALLVPYPHHRDRHQVLNAEALATAGAATVVAARSEAFREAFLGLVEDRTRLVAMANAARSLGVPDSATRIAEVVATHLDRVPRVGIRGESPPGMSAAVEGGVGGSEA